MPRPRSVSRSGDAVISNAELARIFNEIGDMLEILGEVVYKAVAYRRVADAVERYPDDVAALFQRGEPPKIPGAGEALTAKLAELAETGRLEYHERLRAQVPDGVLEMLRVPGVGPRTVRLLHETLGIDSLDGLRAAAESRRPPPREGALGADRAEHPGGHRADRANEHAACSSMTPMRSSPISSRGCGTCGACGASSPPGRSAGASRRSETWTCSRRSMIPMRSSKPSTACPRWRRSSRPAPTSRASCSGDGPRVDLMVCPPAAWGTHLVHFTGNVEHNIALRGMALDRGWSLSEKGFKVIETGELLLDAEEADVYERLGLPWMPPELRKGDGEIEAAAGRNPADRRHP